MCTHAAVDQENRVSSRSWSGLKKAWGIGHWLAKPGLGHACEVQELCRSNAGPSSIQEGSSALCLYLTRCCWHRPVLWCAMLCWLSSHSPNSSHHTSFFILSIPMYCAQVMWVSVLSCAAELDSIRESWALALVQGSTGAVQVYRRQPTVCCVLLCAVCCASCAKGLYS